MIARKRFPAPFPSNPTQKPSHSPYIATVSALIGVETSLRT